MAETIKRVSIIGIGAFAPAKILNNAYFEKIVDTSDEWITTRTGIKERRAVEGDECTSVMATKAALMALDEAKLKPEDLDLIIIGTVTADNPFPSAACYVQNRLKAFNAAAFDVGAACSGFMYSIRVGHQLVAGGAYKNVLVVGAETLTRITDYTERSNCVLFGDGAGAVVLQPHHHGHEIIYSFVGADGSGSEFIVMPGGGSRNPASHKTVDERQHCIKMRGREVFKFAVTKMADMVAFGAKQCKLKLDDITMIVPHQVNMRILEAAAERLKFPMEKIFVNIHKFGNSSSASVPMALNEVAKSGRLKKGDIIVLVAFGGGLTWGVTVIRW